jgi:hypothetical protein
VTIVDATLRSEFAKVRMQRSTFWLFIAALLFGIMQTTSAVVATATAGKKLGMPGLDTTLGVNSVYANSMSSYIFALIIGIMISTGEFRHGTAVATYLAQPNRARVMVAKMVVGSVVGLVVQLASSIVGTLAAAALLTRYDHVPADMAEVWRYIWVAGVSGVILGIIGVALGQLIRNQVAVIVGSIFWLFLVEGLVVTFAESIGKWLPTGAITGMTNLKYESDIVDLGQNLLGPTASTVLLLAYGAAFAGAAMATTMRRDID